MYGSLAEADTYFVDNEFDGLWETYTDSQKTTALNKATKQIDRLPLVGWKFEETQENAFPRVWFNFSHRVIFFDLLATGGVEVPKDVEEATYLQAKFLLDNKDNERLVAQRQGVTSITVGSTSESYNPGQLALDVKTQMSQEAMGLLEKYLKLGW